MVKISRTTQRGRRNGGKSFSSLFSLRNLFVFLVSVQGLRWLMMETKESASHINDSPRGIAQSLADSKVRKGVNTKRANEDHIKRESSLSKDSTKRDIVKSPIRKRENTKRANEDHVKEESSLSKDSKEHEIVEEHEIAEEPVMDHEESPDAPDEKNSAKDPDKSSKQEGDSSVDLNPIVIDKKGTGPTSVGYVKDFVYERNNPAYKNIEAPFSDPTSNIAKLTNEKSVLPCHDEATGLINSRCSDKDTPLIAYNPESFQRTWCGKEIKPKSAAVMSEHCTELISHLFPTEVPPISGDHMPPIKIKSSVDKLVEEADFEEVECDIPCRQEKGLNLGGPGKSDVCYIDGETWKITMSKNSGAGQKMDRTDYMNDHFYSTQSLTSSVPLSTFNSTIYSFRNRPMVDYETAEKKAIYLVNDNCSAQKRNRWFDAVKAKVTVDSYGKCGHNKEVPQGMTISTPEGRIALSKQYRIVLAFDETNSKDHISEVVWEAFVSGAVPVVLGADNLRDRLPPNSFINVKDYNHWDELGDYVKKVISDKDLWLSYHKWRDDDKVIEKFERQYEFTRTGSTCRLCRWAYAKKYGLGWDHTKQEVRSIPKVPKDEFCSTADHGLVSKPFSEQWVTADDKVLKEDSEGQSCSSLETDGTVNVGTFKANRKIYQHDGVTDIIITESTDETEDAETTLRLVFPNVRNPDGACFYNTHTLVSTDKGSKVSSASIQDDLVKITILASWDTTIKSSAEGIMDVVIKNDGKAKTDDAVSIPRRVRVIIEEMNPVYDKMTEFFPSSYCKLMTKDFIDPIGVYFVDS